jgi:hypothetical protein
MKLFSHLFAKPPPPPPPTPAERVASLQAAPTEVIETTALASDEVSLRVGAIRLLPGGDTLRVLAGLADASPGVAASTPPAVRRAAHERLAQLIDDGSIDFDSVCGRAEYLSESIAVAALCKDPDRLSRVLARIDDQATLATLATDGSSSRVRQSAAALIEDPVQLHALLPRVRGKDKSVYKLIRQKCDALAAAEHKAEELAREVTEVCASLERHSTRTHDAFYVTTLETLTARWRALPERPSPQMEQRADEAMERCRELIAEHERLVAQQAAERAAERAAEHAAEQQAREERERELEVERQAAAERAEARAHELAEAAAAREVEDHARAEQRAAETHAQREIGSLIRLASDALHRGNSRKAARFRMGIEEAMQAAPAVPPHLMRHLQQLDERLNELKQWKDYAVAPKRIELIEEMEALVGSEEEPGALAEHIRALQQEWRTINKGIASDAPAETERFQQAYQAAFKPCQEFFALQAAARRENLEARKQVLERLKAFEATQQGELADFPLVAQVLREAPREWRSHSPVDRDASRPAEIEFQQAMDRLRTMLNAWYERNEAAKKSLIAQARHLSTAEDTTAAIDGVKRLNVLWKETGPVPREQSQTLWDEFRSLCDAVFQRREQAYTQYSAALETAKTQAVALCEQVEQAAGEAAADRLPGHAKVAEWHAAFEALGELPRAEARNLRDRFQRAVSRYEDGLARQDSRDAEAAESNLFEAARLVRAYERAVTQDAPSAERETLKSAVESFMAGVHRWPKGALQALKQALTRADSASAADVAPREQALRMLCIRCEILTSTPTPTEDETLRREYQMRLLMESMGQGKRVDAQTWDAMLLEWIEIGAVAPAVHEELQRRFMRCLAKRPANDSTESQFRNYKGDNRPARDPDDRNARRDGRGRPDNGGRGRSDSGGRR